MVYLIKIIVLSVIFLNVVVLYTDSCVWVYIP